MSITRSHVTPTTSPPTEPPPSGVVLSPPGRVQVRRSSFELHGFEEAQGLLSTLYANCAVEPTSDRPFACVLQVDTIGGLRMMSGSWSAGWRARAPAVEDRYIISIAREGNGRGRHGRESFEVVPGRSAAILSPGATVDFEAGAGLEGRALTLERAAVESQVLTLTGRSLHGPIHFDSSIDIANGPGAGFAQIAAVLRLEVARPEGSSLLAGALREALVTSLLVGIKHSAAALFEAQPPRIAPRQVRRAEEFIAAHAAEPITLSDIAAAAGVSVRSLQVTFKSARGVSPMEWLRRVRFDLVRARLLSPAPDATVGSIIGSLSLGGASGRFSVDYRRRFGESPSATLARARGGAMRVAGARPPRRGRPSAQRELDAPGARGLELDQYLAFGAAVREHALERADLVSLEEEGELAQVKDVGAVIHLLGDHLAAADHLAVHPRPALEERLELTAEHGEQGAPDGAPHHHVEGTAADEAEAFSRRDDGVRVPRRGHEQAQEIGERVVVEALVAAVGDACGPAEIGVRQPGAGAGAEQVEEEQALAGRARRDVRELGVEIHRGVESRRTEARRCRAARGRRLGEGRARRRRGQGRARRRRGQGRARCRRGRG
jgi:AraC-like DNA-binding protein